MREPAREGVIERRRAQWRRYNLSDKGQARNARYEATMKARDRKVFYEHTVRAVNRAPSGVLSGTRTDGKPKYSPFHGCWRVSFAHPNDYGITAASPDVLNLEQRLRPDEFKARAEYAALMRRERAEGVTRTLGQLLPGGSGQGMEGRPRREREP